MGEFRKSVSATGVISECKEVERAEKFQDWSTKGTYMSGIVDEGPCIYYSIPSRIMNGV